MFAGSDSRFDRALSRVYPAENVADFSRRVRLRRVSTAPINPGMLDRLCRPRLLHMLGIVIF